MCLIFGMSDDVSQKLVFMFAIQIMFVSFVYFVFSSGNII